MAESTPLTVYCLCAAWCRTCDAYVEVFESLRQQGPDGVQWVWMDVEDSAELLDDIDVENFPTLLMADATQAYFFGPVLPHAAVATQMIERLREGRLSPLDDGDIADLVQRLDAAKPSLNAVRSGAI